MKKIILNILVILIPAVFGKGSEVNNGSTIHKVSPLDKEAILSEVHWILQKASDGIFKIDDKNCKNLSVVFEAGILKASVNNKNFYILTEEKQIESKRYAPSTCFQKVSDKNTQIECISRSVQALKNMNQKEMLIFYISYNQDFLLSCPSDKTIEI